MLAGVLVAALAASVVWVSKNGTGTPSPSTATGHAATLIPLAEADGTGPGPRTVEAGVPVGYAPTKEGAAAAATEYLATLARLVSADPSAREQALRRMASASATDLVEAALRALASLDGSGTRLVLAEVPVAYRVVGGVEEGAEVDVWSVVLAAVGDSYQEAWSTNTLGLTWEDGDWRVAWWVQASGPAPAEGSLAGAEGWSGYRHAPLP